MKYLFIIFIFTLSLFAKEEGKALYHSCKFCHGYNAEVKYMGEIPELKNMKAEEIEVKLRLYKKGELNVYGYGSMMKMQMKNIPEEKIPALASYIEQL